MTSAIVPRKLSSLPCLWPFALIQFGTHGRSQGNPLSAGKLVEKDISTLSMKNSVGLIKTWKRDCSKGEERKDVDMYYRQSTRRPGRSNGTKK